MTWFQYDYVLHHKESPMHADSRVPPREIFDADTSPSLSSNRKAGLCRNIGTMWVMRWRRLRDGDDSTERGFAGADEQSNLPWPVASTHGGLVCSSLLITLVHCCFSYYIKQLLMVITMSKHYFSSFVKKPSRACLLARSVFLLSEAAAPPRQ